MKKQLSFIQALAHLLIGTFAYTALCLESQAKVNNDSNTFHPMQNENVRKYMKAKQVKFLENRGQMTDMDGKPVPFVLFKAEAPGMDMYITEKGLTYIFNKFHEEEINEEEKTESNEAEEQGIEKKKKWITWDRIDMTLEGASIKKENIIKEGMSEDFSQYFLGHYPNGITNVRSYKKIKIINVYPGIDWIFYNSTEKGFKYDFIVHPGADPKQIALIYSSLYPLQLNKDGSLEITTKIGTLTENAPYSYIKENNQKVATQFQLNEREHIVPSDFSSKGYYQVAIEFNIESRNIKQGTLVIDPQLFWATFIGGSGSEYPTSITTDASGDIFVTGCGMSSSLNFPVKNGPPGTFFQGTCNGFADAFILKFCNMGVLLWATYYGGSSNDAGTFIAVDNSDNVFITGFTSSSDFPVKSGPSGTFFQGTPNGAGDAFISKFDNAGNPLWVTYYGGNEFDEGNSISVDNSNNVFITGNTNSSDFPVWNAFQDTHNGAVDAFISKFDNVGNLLWSTFYGGNSDDFGNAIATDGAGNIFVTGRTFSNNFPVKNSGTYFQQFRDSVPFLSNTSDCFILKFNNSGTPSWATYYGGIVNDRGHSIALDNNGNVFVTGFTNSINFPVYQDTGAFFQGTLSWDPGLLSLTIPYDAFILKFDNIGNRLWATYYGGTGTELYSFGAAENCFDKLAIDNYGMVYVSFETGSTDIFTQSPSDGGYFKNTLSSFWADGFILRFSNRGKLLWATYFGGDGTDLLYPLAVDNDGNLVVAGVWIQSSTSYPLINPGCGAYYDDTHNGESDCFIAKFQFMPITTSTTSQSQVNTNSGCLCDGSATLHADLTCGGSPVYLWNTGATTNSITDLCPGLYSVIIFSNSCTLQGDTLYFTILGPPPVTVTTSSTAATCGNNDGTATVNPSGGTLPYTYSWSPNTGGQISQTASNLEAGIYTCTVTDVMNCSVTLTVTVSNSGGATAIIDSITNVSCYGGNDGAVYITATGNTVPFSYSWSNDSITKDITAITTGTYFLTVTDANECKTIISATVAEPSLLSAQIISNTPASCNGTGDGAIDITVAGGTGNYSYSWSNGANTEDINGLSAGVYNLVVTDDNGCIATTGTTISEPAILTTALDTIINVACNGENSGAIYIMVTGGTTPYTYSWSNGALTEDIAELITGNYKAIITDAEGCRDSIEATITEPPALTVVIDNVTHLICGGDNNGTIDITVSGGIAPYSYSWSNEDTTGNIQDLIAGNYSLLLTDANGCTLITDTTITEPPPIIISFTNLNHVSCYGAGDGSATADVSGGAAPYSYTWDPPVSSTPTAFNLAPGNYTVLIKDDNDCEQTASFTMNEPDSLMAAVSGPVSICEGKSAIIHAIVTGGTAPYTYSWSPGAMNDSSVTVSPSVTTTYSVVVTDANGCTATPEGITITLNALPIISFTADPKSGCAPLCVSFNNTTLNTSTVSWNFGDGNSGAEAAITHCYADPGTYDVTLTITGNNGCTNSLLAPDLIKVFPNPIANFTMTPPYAAPIYSTVFFHDQSLGAFNWLWNFGDIANTSSTVKNPAFSYKETGAYTVNLIVKSDEDCGDTISHTIIIEPEFSLYIPNAFTPDNDGINDFFSPKGVEFSSFEMEIYSRWGEKMYHTSDIDKPWNGRIKGETEVVQQDVYIYKIQVKDFKDETHYYVGNVTLIR